MDDPHSDDPFLRYFERQLAWSVSQRSASKPPPLIVLVGSDEDIRTAYLEECREVCAGSKSVPHAYVTVSADQPDAIARLLDESRNLLKEGRTRVRFPRFDLVRYLMGASPLAEAQNRKFQRAMRAHAREQGPLRALNSRRRPAVSILVEKALGPLITALAGGLALFTQLHWSIAQTTAVVSVAAALTGAAIWTFPQLVPSVRTARRWLGEQYKASRWQDPALRLWKNYYQEGNRTPIDSDVARLMIDAWYDDIHQHYWSWRVRWPFRSSQIAPCVILLDHMAPDGPGAALLFRINQRRMEQRTDRPDRVLVVAAGTKDDVPTKVGFYEINHNELDQDPVPWRDQRLPDGNRLTWYRVIRLKGAAGSIRRSRRLPRWPLRARPRFPLLLAIGLLLVVGIPYGVDLFFEYRDYCDASPTPGHNTVWKADTGECVGVTDGSHEFAREFREIESYIFEANQEVVRSGKRYVTLVVMAPFTVVDAQTEVDNITVLQGIAVAQREHNEGQDVQMRVLIANSGEGTKYAEDVARDIIELAEHDEGLVGVVGLGQSRIENQKAIEMFDAAEIPMVASTTTADRFGHDRSTGTVSEYYFQVAPSNNRQAAIMASFTRPDTPATRSTGFGSRLELPEARTASIVYDPQDFYSRNLYEDFQAHFQRDGRTIKDVYRYDASNSDQVQQQLHGIAVSICADKPDLIYYAGRGSELEWLVRGLGVTPCNSGDVVIAAGDDVSTLVQDQFSLVQQHRFLHLFYTALAYPGVWEAATPPPFFEYITDLSVTQDIELDDGQAILTYDAALVLGRAIIEAADAVGDRDPIRADVARYLDRWRSGTDKPEPIGGASGLLDLSEVTATYAPKAKLTVLLGINASMNRPGLVVLCGKLNEGTSGDEGCPSVD